MASRFMNAAMRSSPLGRLVARRSRPQHKWYDGTEIPEEVRRMHADPHKFNPYHWSNYQCDPPPVHVSWKPDLDAYHAVTNANKWKQGQVTAMFLFIFGGSTAASFFAIEYQQRKQGFK